MNIHVSAAEALALDPNLRIFAHDVHTGLSRSPKQLQPKYFYDAEGSALFEEITVLPEYYPTRTELTILRDHANEIADLADEGAALVEFGAGATTKARLLLSSGRFRAYVPVDISADFLNGQADELRSDFPHLAVYPVAADFTRPFALPAEIADLPKVGFFPGSTLGNFDPQDAHMFLRSARRILGDRARMVIGVDLEKDERTLHAAYNDAAGVTGRFNINLLKRINDELGGDFNLSEFAHDAVYNRDQHRIEMHLVSRRPQIVHVLGRSFQFGEGETIHTESSYKYSVPRFRALAENAGWTLQQSWTDANEMFSVHVLMSE
jgi:dimethylhistidine N-methyltransferase